MNSRWEANEGRDALSPFMRAIFERIERGNFAGSVAASWIASIETNDELNSEWDCLFTVRLPEGGVAEIEYSKSTAEEIFYDCNVTDVKWAADLVINVLWRLNYERRQKGMRDAFNQQQRIIKQRLHRWRSVYGFNVHFEKSKLRWTEWGRVYDEVEHVYQIFSLDQTLQFSKMTFESLIYLDISDHLDKLFVDLLERHGAKAALDRIGADGSIDLLALRAAQADFPPEALFKQIARDTSDTYLNDLGHISIDRTLKSGTDIKFQGSSITIYGVDLPEAQRLRAIGEPVTKLVEHPYLTPEMIITKAENFPGSFKLEFTQPRLYFCSLSGRYWREILPDRPL